MTPSAGIAVMLCRPELSGGERNVRKLLEFFGIKTERAFADAPNCLAVLPDGLAPGGYHLVTSASTLAEALKRSGTPTRGLPPLLASAGSVFVYGFDGSQTSRKLLRWLTGDPHADVQPIHSAQAGVSVTADAPEACGPMSGLVVPSLTLDSAVLLKGSGGCTYQSLIATAGGELFARSRCEEVPVYLSAADITLDLDSPVKGNFFDIKQCFCAMVPAVLYLRWAFRGVCWTSPEINASLIVDDPLLKPRYGSLVYADLLALMDAHRFSTTMAFIPWNWRRTNKKTARLINGHHDRLSVVVHGCDHTAQEFGTRSAATLNGKIKTALRRMEAHRQQTGVGYIKMMVFPEGVFSKEAARVLKYNNFVAAANTEVSPSGEGEGNTPIADVWNVAIMRYSCFPIFTRRYISHGLENFAFDALLGKPCLMVAHHDAFRDQARGLVECIDRINRLNASVRWRSLGETIERSYRVRVNADGTTGVEMCGNVATLENDQSEPRTFEILKKECEPEGVKAVLQNGSPIEWDHDGRYVRFKATASPKGRTRLCVEYRDIFGSTVPVERRTYRAKVALRRWLSEIRDDHVSKNEVLNGLARRVVSALRTQ